MTPDPLTPSPVGPTSDLIARLRSESEEHPTVYATDRLIKALLWEAASELAALVKEREALKAQIELFGKALELERATLAEREAFWKEELTDQTDALRFTLNESKAQLRKAREELQNIKEIADAKRVYVQQCNHPPEVVICGEDGYFCCECWAIEERKRAETAECQLAERDREIEELKQSKEIILDRLDDAIAVGMDRDEKSELVSEVLKESGKVFANERDSLRAQLAEAQERNDQLQKLLNGLSDDKENEQLRAELAETQRERDLAIAHDRQPYPTAWAYEQACAALNKSREKLKEAETDAREANRRWEGVVELNITFTNQLLALQAHVEKLREALVQLRQMPVLSGGSQAIIDDALFSQPDLPLIEEVRKDVQEIKRNAETMGRGGSCIQIIAIAEELLTRLNPRK